MDQGTKNVLKQINALNLDGWQMFEASLKQKEYDSQTKVSNKKLISIGEKAELRRKLIEWKTNYDHQRAWKKNQEAWK